MFLNRISGSLDMYVFPRSGLVQLCPAPDETKQLGAVLLVSGLACEGVCQGQPGYPNVPTHGLETVSKHLWLPFQQHQKRAVEKVPNL